MSTPSKATAPEAKADGAPPKAAPDSRSVRVQPEQSEVIAPAIVYDEPAAPMRDAPDWIRNTVRRTGLAWAAHVRFATTDCEAAPGPQYICPEQRGFMPKRNFLPNVLDLDTESRVASIEATDFTMPSMVLLDILAAFPHLAHAWLWFVLEVARVNSAIVSFVKGVYLLAHSVADRTSLSPLLFFFFSGVLQGCPLSGTLWALSRWLQGLLQVPVPGMLRACADDLGLVLHHIQQLHAVDKVFSLAGKVANLKLAPPKCKLIPLIRMLDPELKEFLASWLKENVPNFQDFSIVAQGLYLGFMLGPGASASYGVAVDKYQTRMVLLGRAASHAAVQVLNHNQRVASVLSYLAQREKLPPDAPKMQVRAHNAALHLPPLHNRYGRKHLPPRYQVP